MSDQPSPSIRPPLRRSGLDQALPAHGAIAGGGQVHLEADFRRRNRVHRTLATELLIIDRCLFVSGANGFTIQFSASVSDSVPQRQGHCEQGLAAPEFESFCKPVKLPRSGLVKQSATPVIAGSGSFRSFRRHGGTVLRNKNSSAAYVIPSHLCAIALIG